MSVRTIRSASARPSSSSGSSTMTITTTKGSSISPKKPTAIRASIQGGHGMIATLSGKRVDSLPDLAHLSLRASTPDVSSLVMPQPRKALVSPKIILTTQCSPFESAFGEILETTTTEGEEPSVQREALSELMEILCASRLGSWNGGSSDSISGDDSPRIHRSPRDEDMIPLTPSQTMDVPSLSNSPAFFRGQTELSPVNFDDDDDVDLSDSYGTPPTRAQNPLAMSCHFANMEQGAELDLFRPSPPIYERVDGYSSRLNWD